jgi:hypothetical protein
MLNPFFTVIITLTDKLSYLFPFTLDSLILQKGSASFEVIIVDGSKGKVSLNHLPLENVTILHSVSSNPSCMLNLALSVAKGHYIHCMMPGEFYISKKALSFALKIIHAHDFPDLMYTARMVRHSFGQPTLDMQPLSTGDLKKGRAAPSLQPFWLRREALVMLGGFNQKYEIQGGYDVICRFFLAPTLKKAFVRRILTDYEYRMPPSSYVLQSCLETFWISFTHFGPTLHLFSWIMQNCLRLFRFSWKLIRSSFWKRHVAY